MHGPHHVAKIQYDDTTALFRQVEFRAIDLLDRKLRRNLPDFCERRLLLLLRGQHSKRDYQQND